VSDTPGNGTAKPKRSPEAKLEALRARIELRKLRVQEAMVSKQERLLNIHEDRAARQAYRKLREGVSESASDGLGLSATWGQMVDPRSAFPDLDGLSPLSWMNLPSDRQHGRDRPFWQFLQQLDYFRQASNILCTTNTLAKGILKNLTNYLIGTGFKYQAVVKEKAKPPAPVAAPVPPAPALANGELPAPASLPTPPPPPDPAKQVAEAVQEVIDHFLGEADPLTRMTPWNWREREAFRRTRREGDCFIRLFRRQGGYTETRMVDAVLVRDPPGAKLEDGWSHGIKHRVYLNAKNQLCEDVETIEAYCIVNAANAAEYEIVAAAEIVHIKNLDTDSTVKRGLPDFIYDTRAACERHGKLQRNLSEGAALRAAIAWIEEFQAATKDEIHDFSDGRAEQTTTDLLSGRTINTERFHPGTIARIGKNKKFINPPSAGDSAANDAAVVQGDARQALQAFCAPEFMSSDASNADYSSTKEAGAPFVKMGETDQTYFRGHFLRVIWAVVRWAVEGGRLPPDALKLIDIQVEAPSILQRDPLQQAQRDEILIDKGVLSVQTAQMEWGYDVDVESANRAEWKAKNPEPVMGMGAPPGANGQGGGAPDMLPPILEATDASGHEHKGPGPGGGQFTGSAGAQAVHAHLSQADKHQTIKAIAKRLKMHPDAVTNALVELRDAGHLDMQAASYKVKPQAAAGVPAASTPAPPQAPAARPPDSAQPIENRLSDAATAAASDARNQLRIPCSSKRTGIVGEVDALGNVDTFVLDNTYSKLPGWSGNNEVFRALGNRMDAMRQAAESGAPWDEERIRRNLEAHARDFVTVAAGLKAIGMQKEGEFYAAHGPKLAELCLQYALSHWRKQ
jgi:hypothetical protein